MKYQQIGDIIIFNKLDKKNAKQIIKKFPKIKTICVRTGKIKGQFRQPQIKVLISRAKSKKTETIHKESGILYKLDVSKIMFSKGNFIERKRIIPLVKAGEVIIDMFCGVGYFSLGLAKFSKTKKVYAIEINPIAYHYFLENIKLNKVKNIKPILGDCSKIVPRLKIKTDRIIMGLLPSPFKYLKTAFKVAKKGTVIHYSCLISRREKDKDIKKIINKINSVAFMYKFKIKILRAVRVKSYSPALDHYVLDLIVLS